MKTSSKLLLSLCALFAYLVIAYLYFGRGLLGQMNHALSGDGGSDTYIYLWGLHWWPYVIAHHAHAFLTRIVWSPTGYNLTHATTIPGLFFLTLPIQLLSTPMVAYNVGAIFTPGLAAWSMFLLAFYLTKRFLPALFAGCFFGFSGYIIGQMAGHYNLTGGIFIIPLLILCGFLYLNDDIRGKLFVALSALGLLFLFSVSLEIFTTFTFAWIVTLLIGYFFSSRKTNIKSLFIRSILAYVIAGIILSPFLYYFFTDHIMGGYVNSVTTYSNDLLGFIIPTHFYLLSSPGTLTVSSHFLGFPAEQDAYLGAPLILLLIVFFAKEWARRYVKYLLTLLLIFAIVSMGPVLHIDGSKLITILPNKILFHLPLIKNSLPGRYAVYTSLITSLIVAFWLKPSKCILWKYLLAAIALLFIIPSMSMRHRTRYFVPSVPSFFAQQRYKQWIKPNANVLIIPYGLQTSNIFYQEQSDYYFRMPGGYLGITPKAFRIPIVNQLSQDHANAISKKGFKHFIQTKHVDDVIILDNKHQKYKKLEDWLPHPPVHVGGIWLYRIK